MKYTVELDDRSKTGKNLLGLIEDLSKTSKSIKLISEEEEDKNLLKKMNSSLASGLLSEKETKDFLKQLKKDAGI